MDKRLFRFAYAIEFPVVLMAVLTLWSQIAGQGHLDLMPWYWKLALGIGTALAAVRTTMAAMEHEQAWNSRTLKWIGITLALLLVCGVVTYYYHLNEPQDEQDQPADEVGQIQACQLAHFIPARVFYGATGSSIRSLARVPLIRISLVPLVSSISSRPSSCVAPRPA